MPTAYEPKFSPLQKTTSVIWQVVTYILLYVLPVVLFVGLLAFSVLLPFFSN